MIESSSSHSKKLSLRRKPSSNDGLCYFTSVVVVVVVVVVNKRDFICVSIGGDEVVSKRSSRRKDDGIAFTSMLRNDVLFKQTVCSHVACVGDGEEKKKRHGSRSERGARRERPTGASALSESVSALTPPSLPATPELPRAAASRAAASRAAKLQV